jgi:hypothetical protein
MEVQIDETQAWRLLTQALLSSSSSVTAAAAAFTFASTAPTSSSTTSFAASRLFLLLLQPTQEVLSSAVVIHTPLWDRRIERPSLIKKFGCHVEASSLKGIFSNHYAASNNTIIGVAYDPQSTTIGGFRRKNQTDV